MLLKMVLYCIGEELRIGRTSRTTAKDMLRELRNLIRGTVRHIGARRHAGIGSQHDTVLASDGHDGGPRLYFIVCLGEERATVHCG